MKMMIKSYKKNITKIKKTRFLWKKYKKITYKILAEKSLLKKRKNIINIRKKYSKVNYRKQKNNQKFTAKI